MFFRYFPCSQTGSQVHRFTRSLFNYGFIFDYFLTLTPESRPQNPEFSRRSRRLTQIFFRYFFLLPDWFTGLLVHFSIMDLFSIIFLTPTPESRPQNPEFLPQINADAFRCSLTCSQVSSFTITPQIILDTLDFAEEKILRTKLLFSQS